MRKVRIGKQEVSAIGLGTWQYGAKEWDWQENQREDARQIIRRAVELGIDVIDTAEAYAKGESEAIIGEAIEGIRDQIFLATKLFPIFPVPGKIRNAIAGSLKRLRVEQVDLYQIHWPNPLIPLSAQMKGMRTARDAGQTRHIGVSNFNLGMWKKAERLLDGPVMSNQVNFSILRRKAEQMLPWARNNGRVVIAYSPLAQGLLTGKYTAENAPGGARKMNSLFTRANIKAAQVVLDAVREIADAHQATMAQIALAWLIHQPNVIAIPGAKNMKQLEENVAAGSIKLADDELRHLTEAADGFQRVGLRAMPQLAGRLVKA